MYRPIAAIVAMALAVPGSAALAAPAPAASALRSGVSGGSPCERVEMGPTVKLPVGKSTLIKPQAPIARILLGNPENAQAARPTEGEKKEANTNAAAGGQQNAQRPGVADVDVLLLSPTEIYLLGKTMGSTNVVLLDRSGACTLVDVVVKMDTKALETTLQELLPSEGGIKVSSAADSLVLSGTVSDAAAVERAVGLAGAYVRTVSGGSAGGRAETHDHVINMLAVAAPQQVMLEVKVAEVSKALLDQYGLNFARAYSPADGSMIRFLSGIFGGKGLLAGHIGGTVGGSVGGGAVGSLNNGTFTSGNTAPAGSATIGGDSTTIPIATAKNTTTISSDMQKQDGLVKILAEPTMMAISGQEGRFLAGGKIFIPVASNNSSGGTSITLEEKEFGVRLTFKPTVLGDGRINLKVHPEVSELNAQGVAITATNVAGTAILPSFTVRSAETTVQLMDGQSFAIGGLIKNNVKANLTAFPFLGEVPILGALFRSTSFQNDRTELVFVVTPRLVKPLPANYALPTDGYVPPSRTDMILNGKLEGDRREPEASAASSDAGTQTPAQGGFEVK